jgi:arabinose-5-phosphate isomerase
MLAPMQRPAHEIGREVIRREESALGRLAASLGADFDRAVDLLLGCRGRVVVCGMGKSGHVGRKISSTLVSTGTDSAFLHPAEGFHGDVGVVTARDVALAISNSGTTREVLELVPVIRNLGAKVIALTASPASPLARAADVALCWGDEREADPMELVPTVSAALTLALGDALTVALMARRGFDRTDYLLFHPSGAIGKKLTVRVIDLLRGPHTNPTVPESATFSEALEVVTRYTLGGVSVVDPAGRLVGILTDGDIRRAIQRAEGRVGDLLGRGVSEVMTRRPAVTRPDALAVDALRQMEAHQPRPIFLLPVADAEGRAVGMIHLHTLVQAGLASDRGGPGPGPQAG